jgi:hypothetical protein
VPYIPSGDELKSHAEIQVCMLADVLIENEDEREIFKERALSGISDRL